jgi:membrane-associated protein
MNTLVPILINWLQQYGYPALWACVFIAAIGIPLPISLVFLAAGAFAALGDFNLILLALIGLSASVSGDSVGYLLGRKWGSKVFVKLTRHSRLRLISPQRLEKSRLYFIKRGGLAIFLTRFLLSGLGGAINIIAGAELYPYRPFLLYDLCGELLGTLIPLVLGYIFGASWEAVGDILSTSSLAVVAILFAIYLAWRLIRQIQRSQRETIQVALIAKAKKSNDEIERTKDSATFNVSQTYTKEINGYFQPGLDHLPGNYAKNGPEGLE